MIYTPNSFIAFPNCEWRFLMQRKKTIKKPQEKDFFQSHGHKSVLKKRNDSMGIYFGHILLLN